MAETHALAHTRRQWIERQIKLVDAGAGHGVNHPVRQDMQNVAQILFHAGIATGLVERGQAFEEMQMRVQRLDLAPVSFITGLGALPLATDRLPILGQYLRITFRGRVAGALFQEPV